MKLETANLTDVAPAAQAYSESVPGAPLEAVLYRDELDRRPCRPRDEQLLNAAIKKLIQGFSSAPESVLQSLSDTILNILHCDSAGVSLINDDNTRFYWPAISGVWQPHIGGGTPRYFGPCGDVLHLNRPLHMQQIHKRYTYFTPVAHVKEALLVPFSFENQIVGTLWAVIHEPPHDKNSRSRNPQQLDREDLRILEALSRLATAAYQIWIAGQRNT